MASDFKHDLYVRLTDQQLYKLDQLQMKAGLPAAAVVRLLIEDAVHLRVWPKSRDGEKVDE